MKRLEELEIDHLQLKQDNVELKQSIADTNAPVSYTHLDVYKRQSYKSNAGCWTLGDAF